MSGFENMQASESRIRDTDMAEQMVEFTKNQILQQSSTAMLAQANIVPQSVLQLFR
jgi:flagellin